MSPDDACISRTTSGIRSSCSAVAPTTTSTPSPRTFSSLSVTSAATSMSRSLPRSSPVISQSIHTSRSLMPAGYVATCHDRVMRWHRLALLLALAGCTGDPGCSLIGCASQLVVQLPPGTTSGSACVGGVCTSEVVGGELRVPLARRADGDTAVVTVELPGAPGYEGEVPLTRTPSERRQLPAGVRQRHRPGRRRRRAGRRGRRGRPRAVVGSADTPTRRRPA